MQVKKDKIPKGWKETTLEKSPLNIIDGDRGKNYPKQEDFSPSGHCLFLNAGNVTSNGFDFSNCSFINEEKDNSLGKGKLKRFDVVLTTRGTVGNIAFYDDSIPFDYIRINSGMVIFRPNAELIPRYLFLFLKSSVFQNQVKQYLTGSAQPQLPIRDINQISFNVQPLAVQKSIAEILGTFDDKIELLRRQNKTLEKIAQTIFKEWFVNFEFPNEKGKPYKSNGGKMIDSELREIPEGWRVGTVNDVIERFSITYRCDKDDLDVQGKTPIIDQGSNGLYGYTKREPDFLASAENPVVVFANHTCNMWFINYPFCAIQNIIPFRGNAEYSTFFVFYMTLEKISFIEYKGHWPDFEQKEYVIPKPDVANKFAEIVKPFKYKIWNDNSQIQTLSRLRDYLLPKLMKGEIRVKS